MIFAKVFPVMILLGILGHSVATMAKHDYSQSARNHLVQDQQLNRQLASSENQQNLETLLIFKNSLNKKLAK